MDIRAIIVLYIVGSELLNVVLKFDMAAVVSSTVCAGSCGSTITGRP